MRLAPGLNEDAIDEVANQNRIEQVTRCICFALFCTL
jgi:hypothetical protein